MTLAAFAFLAALALPPEPAPLVPRGGWTLDHLGGRCAVSRAYPGARALILRQRFDGSRIDLGLAGIDPPSDGYPRIPGHITALPGGRRVDGTLEAVANPAGPAVVEIATRDDPLGDFDTLSALAIGVGQDAPISFAIDQQAAAQAMLRSCQEALVRSWGIDPAQFSPLGTSKVGSRFYGASTYPPDAVRKREQGHVSILIEIPPSGQVDACRVVESSNSTSLDQATCDIARTKVRFTPAVDDAGRPKTIWTIMAMRWVLP